VVKRNKWEEGGEGEGKRTSQLSESLQLGIITFSVISAESFEGTLVLPDSGSVNATQVLQAGKGITMAVETQLDTRELSSVLQGDEQVAERVNNADEVIINTGFKSNDDIEDVSEVSSVNSNVNGQIRISRGQDDFGGDGGNWPAELGGDTTRLVVLERVTPVLAKTAEGTRAITSNATSLINTITALSVSDARLAEGNSIRSRISDGSARSSSADLSLNGEAGAASADGPVAIADLHDVQFRAESSGADKDLVNSGGRVNGDLSGVGGR